MAHCTFPIVVIFVYNVFYQIRPLAPQSLVVLRALIPISSSQVIATFNACDFIFLVSSSVDGISLDLRRNIYILDATNYRVTKWAPGAVTGVVVAGDGNPGDSLRELDSPYGMFVEFNSSIIWIADTFNHRIVKWQSPLSSIGIFVCGSYGSEADQFSYPSGLFVDTLASNTLYVADTDNHRIQLWLPGATSGTTIAGQTGVCGPALDQLCSPSGLTKDGHGYIYVADSSNNRIMKWMIGSTSGMIVAGDATYGVLPNQLNKPYNVKLDANGALIVVDTQNSRIQKFSVVPCGKF